MAVQTVFLAENTTAYATDVMNLVDPLYTDLDGSNVSDKTGTGTTIVLSASPTFTGGVSLNSGADFKIYSDAGTTLKFFVDGATGSFGVANGARFYLDGAGLIGDTYFTNNAVDGIIEAYSNAVRSFTILNTGVGIPATNQLFLDGASQAGSTSIRESSAGVVAVKASGVDRFSISATGIGISSGNKIFFDGVAQAGDSYDIETSANVLDRFAGGVKAISATATSVIIHTNSTFNTSGELLLGNVDPPTANYANRNGIVKAWGTSTSAPALTASYNISSVTRISLGNYQVFFNTNFANTGYGISITAKVPSMSVSVTQNVAYFVVTFVDPSSGAFTDCGFSFIAIGDQ